MSVSHLAGAVVLALVHLFSVRLNLGGLKHRRRWLSLAAGVSVAYVFVDLLPLMSEKQRAFTEAAAGRGLPFPEFRVYLAALVGFVVFYGLEHLVTWDTATADRSAENEGGLSEAKMIPLHLAGFSAYNILTGYLLVEWSEDVVGLMLYCGALGLHFLITDDGLHRDYGRLFCSTGRWLMAGSVVVGAMLASGVPVSADWLALVVGLVAGGVVINSVKDELPRRDEGRFSFFLVGALSYALMILLAAKLESG